MFVMIIINNIKRLQHIMKTAYNLSVEKELWKKFKSKCASEGKTIVAKLTDFIKTFVGEKK